MQDFIDNFHFLRPLWLLAILPLLLIGYLLWWQKRSQSQWQKFIQPELLHHLLEERLSGASRWPFAGLVAAWILASVALAGPTWKQLPQPVHQSEAAVVIAFDMSPSMVAEDFTPSRLERVRFKLRDYLKQREEGLTALVAYAGGAHVVSPLTDDTQTIANLIPALHPAIMPVSGSNVERGLEKALTLFRDAGIPEGEILLVTDGVATDAFPSIRQQLKDSGYRLSILGVGTPEGAPIPTGDGGFARGASNDIVIARLNETELQELAREFGGTYTGLRTDDGDIAHLLNYTERQELRSQQQKLVEREFDIWRDAGQWLALLLLPFAALGFRRGWLLSMGLVAMVGLSAPGTSHALEWRDLWLRSDQQGLKALEKGDPVAAAKEFKRHDWRGTAHYRGDDYAAAAEAFAQGDSARDHYNRGNALARAGKLEDALSAYEAALDRDPEMNDAQFNAELVRELLEKQEEQQQQQDQNQNNQPQQNEQDSAQQDGSEQEQPPDQDGQDSQSGQQAQSDDENSAQGESSSTESSSQEQAGDEEAAEALAEQMEEELRRREQQSQSQEQPSENQNDGEPQPGTTLAESEQADRSEEQQALEQWLRQVPDDPSGLLRRKFEYEHRRLRQQYRRGNWLPPENQGPQRW
ncbi:VWA domain-containing protein [Gilvimarinus sp. F26214L]|uniref:VWA domain-containing protein n=1 Tax=Gilvimarinus sp. DZF01 TaxID=3461371 RepID=UPI0040461D24